MSRKLLDAIRFEERKRVAIQNEVAALREEIRGLEGRLNQRLKGVPHLQVYGYRRFFEQLPTTIPKTSAIRRTPEVSDFISTCKVLHSELEGQMDDHLYCENGFSEPLEE